MNENQISSTEQHDGAKRNFDLTSFARAKAKMIATNDRSFMGSGFANPWRQTAMALREYTPEEILRITDSGSLNEQQKLSRNYFYKDGYYKQIILYFATLLKYQGILIPHPSVGKNLSTSHLQKRYYSANDFVEKMNLPSMLTNCALRALIDGSYFGVRINSKKDGFTLIDLPAQ